MTVPVVHFVVRGQTETASEGTGRPYTLVFDGMCKVCNRLAHALRSWDKRQNIDVVPSQAPGVMARFPWIPRRAFAEAIQLVGPAGETWQGAEAIEQLLGVLPRGRLIAWIFKVPFVRVLADKLYRWFARNRYRLGCGAHCQSRPLNVAFPD
jgi:predicted DCC family thiol-disulfide oxidoreductase YuxK